MIVVDRIAAAVFAAEQLRQLLPPVGPHRIAIQLGTDVRTQLSDLVTHYHDHAATPAAEFDRLAGFPVDAPPADSAPDHISVTARIEVDWGVES